MIKYSYRLTAALAVGIAMTASHGAAQTTRGDAWDRNAAYEVISCARGYINRGIPRGQKEFDYWILCLQAVSESTGRPAKSIAIHVNRINKDPVFGIK